jgi:hypothetical protein
MAATVLGAAFLINAVSFLALIVNLFQCRREMRRSEH